MNRSLNWLATLSGVLLSIALVELFDSVNLQTSRGNLAIANPTSPMPQPASTVRLSQVPALSAQQGTQVSINGQLSAASWSQWQAGGKLRTGISDAGLLKTVGIQLLNTETVSQQPVQWFSPSANSLTLPTRLTTTVRYLDITDFAQQFGWQMQVSGKTLQIASPAAKVLAVRQGKQPWGDRIVIELDRPAPWRTDPQGQDFLLTLSAQSDPSLQSLKPTPGTYLQSLKLEPTSNQTRLRLGISANLRPRIWSLSNPNRIVIDVRPDSLVEQTISWAPGLRWRQQILTLGTARVPVVWLEINPRQPGVSIKPILPNPTSILGTAPLVQTAQQSQVAAAINGGFFNRIRQLPLGAVRVDGRWVSGPILNRGAIAWNLNGDAKFGRLTLRETLTTQTGQRFPLTHLNSGYIQAGIARYTSDWGPTYTSLSDNEILVSVQASRVVNQQTIEKAGSAPIAIPVNGYLLVLRSNKSAASAFPPGSVLQLESTTDPPEFNRYPQIVGAGPLLLQNRQIVLDAKAESFSSAFAAETAARSAIAQAADGTILLVAVHNRLDGVGMTLAEFAQLLQQLGIVNALNLDGGSSTTLYLGEQLLDRPSHTAARVHNGIGVFINPKP